MEAGPGGGVEAEATLFDDVEAVGKAWPFHPSIGKGARSSPLT